MYLPLGESPENIKVGRAGARVLLVLFGFAFAGFFLFVSLVHAACSNPSPLPSGYAAPCPVFSVSPASVSQTGTLTLSAAPQAGTDYIYTTAYYAKGTSWLSLTLQGNNAAPSYSTAQASGSLSSSILSTLTPGTRYVVLWDWLWDAQAQCYKGPGLNQCNTGEWRIQLFTLTSSPTPTPAPYVYSQSAYTSGSCVTGNWSIANQPPIGCRPYPNSLFVKPLPNAGSGGPMNHLAPNSDAIIQNPGTGCVGCGNVMPGFAGVDATGDDSTANPFYYGRASDPVYKLSSCTNPGSDPAHNPTGTFWHIPNKAQYSGLNGDQFFTVWDQTNNLVLSMYKFGSGVKPLPNCTGNDKCHGLQHDRYVLYNGELFYR